MSNLNPEKALIFRIVHVGNVPWILQHGLHCRNSPSQDPNYINIGSESLIDKRSRRRIPLSPGGTLSDYVPFYFTPYSIMMYNIYTGYGGIPKRRKDEIVFFVSSLRKIQELGLTFTFTDQHAYAAGTEFHNSLDDLDKVDWPLLQKRDFKTDDADPGKQLRYQAEALIHQHVPLKAVIGLGCCSDSAKKSLDSKIAAAQLNISVKSVPSWYF